MLDTDSVTTPATTEQGPVRATRASRPLLPLVAAFLAGAVVTAAVFLGVQYRPDLRLPGAAAESRPSGKLSWAPPELTDPETIQVSEDERDLRLDPDRDYVIEMPDEPLEVSGGLVISGGRHVVLIGGEIRTPERRSEDEDMRGLYLKNQTGTVHIEGLHISGDSLTEGINLDQREGAVVQLQNIRVDTVHGEKDGHHADVLQTWAGPSELRIDRLTGYTTYQGFFMLPQQFGDQPEPEVFDFRWINLVGDDAGYLLWRDDEDWPFALQEVWVSTGDEEVDSQDADEIDRDRFLWAHGDSSGDSFDDVKVGMPPGGDFVPADAVGVGYESPGYED